MLICPIFDRGENSMTAKIRPYRSFDLLVLKIFEGQAASFLSKSIVKIRRVTLVPQIASLEN